MVSNVLLCARQSQSSSTQYGTPRGLLLIMIMFIKTVLFASQAASTLVTVHILDVNDNSPVLVGDYSWNYLCTPRTRTRPWCWHPGTVMVPSTVAGSTSPSAVTPPCAATGNSPPSMVCLIIQINYLPFFH